MRRKRIDGIERISCRRQYQSTGIEMPESADNTYMDRARALVAAERKKMKEALQKMGQSLPGEANYIFFRRRDQGRKDLTFGSPS